jgi:tripartite-type tricarboxylate transporter receptor subunit TctC
VSIGVPGRNNINHIFAAMLAKATNTQYTNVSYTGGSKVLIDLAGNHIDAGVVKPSETIGQVKAGLVKAIGVFSNTRVEAMPDLPTFAERKVDVFPYGDVEQVTFLVGPKGVPADRLARAQELFAQVLGSAEYRKFAVDHGMTVTDLSGAKMEKVVRDVQRTFDTVAPKIFTNVVE